ncbi:response regulator [candidate division KSB1 bacterium]|nr:response regulator [candidate division KSB1 bacterium]
MLGKNRYDLLIADIKMPGNDELEFIEEPPAIAEGLPVILVTGYPSLNTAIKSTRLHVAGYMMKPLPPILRLQISMFSCNSPSKTSWPA